MSGNTLIPWNCLLGFYEGNSSISESSSTGELFREWIHYSGYIGLQFIVIPWFVLMRGQSHGRAMKWSYSLNISVLYYLWAANCSKYDFFLRNNCLRLLRRWMWTSVNLQQCDNLKYVLFLCCLLNLLHLPKDWYFIFSVTQNPC